MWGLLPGWSIDFTIDDPDDGKPWDFNCQEKRDKAERMVKDKKGLLIIGSPLCSASSHLGTLNKGKTADWGKRNLNHMRFCAKLYKMQVEQGMYFLHEQPPSAEDAEDSTMVNLGKDWSLHHRGTNEKIRHGDNGELKWGNRQKQSEVPHERRDDCRKNRQKMRWGTQGDTGDTQAVRNLS